MPYIYKMSNAGGMSTVTRYTDMLAGNAAFVLPGDFESIASASGNGSASSVTFSGISSIYKHLQIRLSVRGVRSLAFEQLYLRLNGDSGSNYAFHYILGNGSSVGTSATTSTSVFLVNEMPAANETANVFSTSVINILDSNSTNKNTTMRSLSGYENNGNTSNYNGKVWFGSGLWINTAAVTSVTVLSNGAFNANSRFALYGIKG